MDFKKQYLDIWNLAWSYHKCHFPVRGDDPKYWDEVVSDYGEICKKSRDRPGFELLKALLMAAFEELERIGVCYGRYAEVGKAAGGCAEGEV